MGERNVRYLVTIELSKMHKLRQRFFRRIFDAECVIDAEDQAMTWGIRESDGGESISIKEVEELWISIT